MHHQAGNNKAQWGFEKMAAMCRRLIFFKYIFFKEKFSILIQI